MSNTTSSIYASGDRGHKTTTAAACMIALTTVAVGLRFVARKVSKNAGLWWDDWIALAAWAFGIVDFSFSFDMVARGYGRHIGTVSQGDFDRINLDVFIGQIFYSIGLTLIKMSALLFYVRIFSLKQRWFAGAVYCVGAASVGWCVTIILVGALQYSPRRKLWEPSLPGHCINAKGVWLGTAIPNVIIDFLILILPLPLVSIIQTSRKRRVGLIFVFFMGYCSMAVSVARTIEIEKLTPGKMRDPTWTEYTDMLLVGLDLGLGLVSICLPAHVGFFRYAARHIRNSDRKSVLSKRRTGVFSWYLARPVNKTHAFCANSRDSGSRSQDLALPRNQRIGPETPHSSISRE